MVEILTREAALSDEDRLFLQTVEDDTEEAPWMVMGTPQAWSASGLAWSLRTYVRRERLPWFVASMLPILYQRPGRRRPGQVAPDVLVAFVEDRVRYSYNLREEGVVPAFVLEVISPSSVRQDTIKKRRLYELLGVQEYALFAPEPSATLPALQGYRRGAEGRFVPWQPDDQGRLRSAVLALDLVAEGLDIRAQRLDGTPLLTPEQADLLAHQEEAARQQADLRAEREAAAREQAEDEIARLRVELQRYRQPD